MLDALDPYTLKRALERVNEIRDLAAASADLGLLRRVRRATLPLPLIDRPRPVDSHVFPPVRARPAQSLQGNASLSSPAAEAAEAAEASRWSASRWSASRAHSRRRASAQR